MFRLAVVDRDRRSTVTESNVAHSPDSDSIVTRELDRIIQPYFLPDPHSDSLLQSLVVVLGFALLYPTYGFTDL